MPRSFHWSGLVTAIASIVLPAGTASASALSDAAAALQPGQWSELKTGGYTRSLLATGTTDLVLNYANLGVWDPIRRDIRLTGGGAAETNRMIRYREESNSWDTLYPPETGLGRHGYNQNAIDPATGTGYFRPYYSTRVYAYRDGWTLASELPGEADDYACCGALVWFPELGGLTFWGAGAVYAASGQANGAWRTLKTGLAMGDYHNIGDYSARYARVFGGGGNGSKRLYALDADGKVSDLPDAPVDLGTYAAVHVADPATGEFLVFGRDKTSWSLHPGERRWARIPNPAIPFFSAAENPIEFTVAVQVPDYGVVLFLKEHAVYLYRHLAIGPVPHTGLPRFADPRAASYGAGPFLFRNGVPLFVPRQGGGGYDASGRLRILAPGNK